MILMRFSGYSRKYFFQMFVCYTVFSAVIFAHFVFSFWFPLRFPLNWFSLVILWRVVVEILERASRSFLSSLHHLLDLCWARTDAAKATAFYLSVWTTPYFPWMVEVVTFPPKSHCFHFQTDCGRSSYALKYSRRRLYAPFRQSASLLLIVSFVAT